MLEEHGVEVFVGGCPVCKYKCCCGGLRTAACPRLHHCYKKCQAAKPLVVQEVQPQASLAVVEPVIVAEKMDSAASILVNAKMGAKMGV